MNGLDEKLGRSGSLWSRHLDLLILFTATEALLFEELAAIEVSYSYTTVKITGNDSNVVVFATVPTKYSAVLTSQQSAKGAGLTIDDLEDAIISCRDKEAVARRNIKMMMEVKWCYLPLEGPVTTAKNRA
jgi:hypothetical protein